MVVPENIRKIAKGAAHDRALALGEGPDLGRPDEGRAPEIGVGLAPAAGARQERIVEEGGRLVEHGPAAQIFENPREPYTCALISAAFELELTDESAVRS